MQRWKMPGLQMEPGKSAASIRRYTEQTEKKYNLPDNTETLCQKTIYTLPCPFPPHSGNQGVLSDSDPDFFARL